MWRYPLVLVLVAAVGTTWYLSHDTVGDVLHRHAGRFGEIRAAMRDIDRAMPPEGEVRDTGCPATSAGQQLFDHPDLRQSQYPVAVGNTVVLTHHQLTDHTSENGDFDIAAGSPLLTLLTRTAPGYQPTFGDAMPADDGYGPFVDALSRIRYAVVTRTFDIDTGTTNGTTFTGGSMSAEAVIADLTTRTILCSVTTTATLAADELTYTYRDFDHRAANAQATITGAVLSSATTALQFKLDTLKHGKIDLRW